DRHSPVSRPDRHRDERPVVLDSELRFLMLARKDSAAREMIEPGIGIAQRYVDSFSRFSRRLVPFDREPVRGVLARDREKAGKTLRPDLLQPDQADSPDRMPLVELGPKRCRQKAPHHPRVHSEVDQEPSADYTLDDWKSHRPILRPWARHQKLS